MTAASAHEVPKEVLDGFWKLSDAKENVRIEAGTKIRGENRPWTGEIPISAIVEPRV